MGQKDEGEALRLIGLTYDTALGGHDWTDVLNARRQYRREVRDIAHGGLH